MEYTITFLITFGKGLLYAAPILVFLVLAILSVGLSVGRREGWNQIDAAYYAFITATTVGYGDFHPRLTSSKCKAIFIALVGVLLTGMIVAIGISAAEAAFVKVNDLANQPNAS